MAVSGKPEPWLPWILNDVPHAFLNKRGNGMPIINLSGNPVSLFTVYLDSTKMTIDDLSFLGFGKNSKLEIVLLA